MTDDSPREIHDRELDELREDRSDLPVWNRRRQMLADVNAERNAQIVKWGPQSHPDGTGGSLNIGGSLIEMAGLRNYMRRLCDFKGSQGEGTWLDILFEEVFEAAAETDSEALRKELVQVAAVAGAWIEDIDSRRG